MAEAPQTMINPFDLLEKVDAFYQTSWNHLLVYSGIAVAIVGIIMPILIQLYQNRNARIVEQNFEKRIGELIRNAKDEAKNEIKVELQTALSLAEQKFQNDLTEKINGVSSKMTQHRWQLDGALCHVQAVVMMSQNLIASAAEDLIRAITAYSFSKDFGNLRTCANSLVDSCFARLTKPLIDKVPGLEAEYQKMVERLNKISGEENLGDLIQGVEGAYQAAKARTTL